jgi:hypothetical protein
MERSDYASADYGRPNVPPGTPPVIDSAASAGDAATRDRDEPGSQLSSFDRSLEDEVDFDHGAQGHLQSTGGDRYLPGQQPDELPPDRSDTDQPSQTPDEVGPGQGDFDRPDSAPAEMPAQPGTAPAETPPPPD